MATISKDELLKLLKTGKHIKILTRKRLIKILEERIAPTDKEVLHTQISFVEFNRDSEFAYYDIDIVGGEIGEVGQIKISHEYDKYADLICKAVNKYQTLLDSNRELLEALEGLTKWTVANTDSFPHQLIIATQAIQNAKNLNNGK